MGASKWFFSMSGVILLIGALAIAGKGINFGIDFESGARYTASLEQAGDGRAGAQRASRRPASATPKIQTRRQQGARQERRPDLDRGAGRTDAVEKALEYRFGLAEQVTVEEVGPTFGEDRWPTRP